MFIRRNKNVTNELGWLMRGLKDRDMVSYDKRTKELTVRPDMGQLDLFNLEVKYADSNKA